MPEYDDDFTEMVLGQLEHAKELVRERQKTYKTSPLLTLPLDVWLAQIVIKAERARQAIYETKRGDELDDLMVYTALVKAKELYSAAQHPQMVCIPSPPPPSMEKSPKDLSAKESVKPEGKAVPPPPETPGRKNPFSRPV